MRGKEKALDLNRVTARNVQTKGTDRNTYQGERSMNVISVPVESKDWNGLQPSSIIVEADTLLMETLCCGDSLHIIDRANYIVTAA
jgi:hypothetical protein